MANSQRRLDAMLKQKRAMELRLSGMQYDAIAAEIGYSGASGAYHAVMKALKKTLQEPADELRRVEVQRIDALLEEMWKKKDKVVVVDRIIHLMERRAKLLGLDAPTRQEVTGADGSELIIKYINDWRHPEDDHA